MEDAILIEHGLMGDTEAFSTLVRRYQTAVYGLCCHKVRSPIDAKDLAQETFVAAYLGLRELRDVEKFGHWLYRIASNLCHSWLRKQQGARQIQATSLEGTLDLGDHPVDAAPSPQRQMESQELRASVDQAIGTLSEKNQLVVRLYYIDELSYQEISDFLNLPVTTIKSRLNKARRQLKEVFIDMVASDIRSNPLPDDFPEKVVQEALTQAQEFRQGNRCREVIAQCDLALDTLAQLGETPQYLQWKSEALHMKGGALYFPRGREEAIPYYEQVLAIKKNSGDKREYANYLNFMGGQYKTPEKKIAAYREALALFEELDDPAGQAESHLWLGAQAFFSGDYRVARVHFQPAAKLYDGLDTNRDWKAVCHAALRVVEETQGTPGEDAFLRRGAVCEKLERTSHRISMVGQPGFIGKRVMHGSEEIMGISLFHGIAQMKPILDATWQVGETWEQDVFSYTFNPLRAKKRFESDSEVVRTPAGGFRDCWKFRINAAREPIEDADEQTKRQYELNKINCGSREFWLAPGVGLVKYHADQESGLKGTIELAAYSVQHGESDFFPLAVGNWWEYRPVGLHKNYVYKDRFEVIDQEDQLFFISHAQYAYWNGSEAERRDLLSGQRSCRSRSQAIRKSRCSAFHLRHYSSEHVGRHSGFKDQSREWKGSLFPNRRLKGGRGERDGESNH